MKLIPSDPNIQTLVNMLESGDINPQPEFQRGEVWGVVKKRRLIDSILRNWHVPPIHVILIEKTGELEVLDGQQRLVAIRDFFTGNIAVDGEITPFNDDIYSLNNLKYEDLPEKYARRVRQFAIRMFTVEDYSPEEPGELFYRLNQPTNLTAAEQRNAYYGEVRAQVKSLVKIFHINDIDKYRIGFSNARMAYDDVIARFCYSLSCGTLSEKVTASVVTDLFRSNSQFEGHIYRLAEDTLKVYCDIINSLNNQIKFTKATMYSWLCFISTLSMRNIDYDKTELSDYMYNFEMLRAALKSNKQSIVNSIYFEHTDIDLYNQVGLVGVFNFRASSRVTDVSSVRLRDFILCYIYYKLKLTNNVSIKYDSARMNCIRWFDANIKKVDEYNLEYALSQMLDSMDWGDLA